MIDSPKVPQVMGAALPELKDEVSSLARKDNPYQCLNVLSNYTRHAIENADYDGLERSLQLAAKLYSEGDSPVKRAVENVFVYALGNVLPTASTQRAKLMEKVPLELRAVYYQQVHPACGC